MPHLLTVVAYVALMPAVLLGVIRASTTVTLPSHEGDVGLFVFHLLPV